MSRSVVKPYSVQEKSSQDSVGDDETTQDISQILSDDAPQHITSRRSIQADNSEIEYIELDFETEISAELQAFFGRPDDEKRQDGFSSSSPATPELLRRFQSPYDWPASRKRFTLIGAFIASTLAAYAAGSYAMVTTSLMREWDISLMQANVGITMFVLAFGMVPIVLAPISEAHGRYWVFVGSGIVFCVGQIGCAVTRSYAGMLVSRFVVGSGSSVFATITGGVVGDLYRKRDRNTPMAVYSFTIILGTGSGPLVSGVVGERLGWTWVFWLQAIMTGATAMVIALFFKETRGNVILRKKADALNKHQEAIELSRQHHIPASSNSNDNNNNIEVNNATPQPLPRRIRYKIQTSPRRSFMSLLWWSFTFPLKLLITESVVFWFSLWASFAWAILYMQFSSIGLVFRTTYHFTPTQIGLVYLSVLAGAFIATPLSIYQEKLALKYFASRMTTPEGRLYFACVETLLLPIGLFLFGWSSSNAMPFIVPCVAIALCITGIFVIYLACFNYLTDTYHVYASSALAAQSMCRNLMAGVFPLFTDVMFKRLGYGGAGSLLGGLGLLLMGVPWVL